MHLLKSLRFPLQGSVLEGVGLGISEHLSWVVRNPPTNAGDPGSIPGSGRSPGEGTGNALQYSCLENSTDKGARWAPVHRVAESGTTEQLTLALFTSHLSMGPGPLQPPVTLPSPCSSGARNFGSQASHGTWFCISHCGQITELTQGWSFVD